jgi:phospholipid/cholesterol/gamma-HCH transport system permease protein
MLRRLRQLGQWGLAGLQTLGRAGLVALGAMWVVPSLRGFPLLLRQLYAVGVMSLLIIALSAFSIGAVLGLQFYTQLVRFGAAEALGLGVAIVLVRELGPVVTALLFAGRAGSALTAEIGLMKATEQLSSMEMMGVDPVRRVVAPRLWAGIITMPLLTMMFSVIAIFGAQVVAVDWLGVDAGNFWAGMQDGVSFRNDVVNGVIKAMVFAFVVTWIAVFEGYDAAPTAEGISAATTRTVVYSSTAVLALNFLLSLVMFSEFAQA